MAIKGAPEKSRVAADEWTSLSSAQRTHLAAKRSHVTLLSGDRANLAIARHSISFLIQHAPSLQGGACTGMIAPTATAV